LAVDLHVPSLVSDSVDVIHDFVFGNARVFSEDLHGNLGDRVELVLIPSDVTAGLVHTVCPVVGVGDDGGISILRCGQCCGHVVDDIVI
jgi:hypothetical protein